MSISLILVMLAFCLPLVFLLDVLDIVPLFRQTGDPIDTVIARSRRFDHKHGLCQ